MPRDGSIQNGLWAYRNTLGDPSSRDIYGYMWYHRKIRPEKKTGPMGWKDYRLDIATDYPR